MDKILHYFPHLSPEQVEQYKALGALYTDWNEKINVISRKDIQNLYMHHILHSMSIGKVLPFTKGTTLLDVGTGGGFPTIPLAILFPVVQGPHFENHCSNRRMVNNNDVK